MFISLYFFVPYVCNIIQSVIVISINAVNSIKIVMFKSSLFFNIIGIVIRIMDIINPKNTEIMELALCFITSTSDVASIFGYFKFINSPIIAIRVGNVIDVNSIVNMSYSFILNAIMNIISHSVIIDTTSMLLNSIFDRNISFVVIGNDFEILMVLPSIDIDDEVIEVRHDVNTITARNIFGSSIFMS